jgi:glutaredoxin
MDAARTRSGVTSVVGQRGNDRGFTGIGRRGLVRLMVLGAIAVLMPAAAQAQTSQRNIALELYVRGDEHKQIRESLTAAVAERSGVSLRVFDVAAEGEGQKRHEQICKHFKKTPADMVPAMYACSQLATAPTDAKQIAQKLDEMRTMTVYVRSGCPRCARTKEWLKTVTAKYPGFRLVYRDVVTDGSAQSEMNNVARRYNKSGVSVPMFHVCDEVQIGFDSPESSGRRLTAVLDKWTFEKKKPVEKASSREHTAGARRFAHERAATVQFRGGAAPRAKGQIAAAFPWTAMLLGQIEEAVAEQEDQTESEKAPDEALVASAADSDSDSFELPLPADVEDVALPLPGDVGEAAAGEDAAPASDEIRVPVVGSVRASRLGLPAFTVVIGLVDGFNPCAMWVLLFLLSILVNLQNRWKILAVAGSFVVVSGLAYFAFMAAWLNVMGMVAYEREVQVVLGVFALIIGAVHVKDFFAFKKGVSFSIPESAKPGIATRVRKIIMAENLLGAVIGAMTLAVLINIIELLCTAGLPALYTDILQNQNITGLSKYGYLGLYNLAYMFDDALMVALVVITLDKTRLQEKQGRWLKLISGAFVLALGVIMIFKPSLLQFV